MLKAPVEVVRTAGMSVPLPPKSSCPLWRDGKPWPVTVILLPLIPEGGDSVMEPLAAMATFGPAVGSRLSPVPQDVTTTAIIAAIQVTSVRRILRERC